ncbi:glycosyltransferase family 4 protein [Formosa sp. S-31]
MKIHFIISTLKGGGAERVLSILASEFAKINTYEINVITLNEHKDFYTLHPSVKRISMDFGKIPNHTVKAFFNLSKYYSNKKNRPDLIISFMTLINLITIPIAKFYSIPIIAEEHNSHLRSFKNREFLSKLTKKHLYKRANFLTVLTKFDVPYYTNFGANVVVMPNPCSFPPIKAQEAMDRDKTILAVGNLDRYHHKGFDNLIKFIEPILKSNPEWQLKIVGSGTNGLTILTALVQEHELSNQITFTGFISDISKLMQSSSIFILSSRFEGLPMVLLEAMSQGMACIAYDCKTGPSDIITHKYNGILISNQNASEMQKELQNLIDNKNLRLTIGCNGLKSLKKYHINTIIKNYEELFNKILN